MIGPGKKHRFTNHCWSAVNNNTDSKKPPEYRFVSPLKKCRWEAPGFVTNNEKPTSTQIIVDEAKTSTHHRRARTGTINLSRR